MLEEAALSICDNNQCSDRVKVVQDVVGCRGSDQRYGSEESRTRWKEGSAEMNRAPGTGTRLRFWKT